MGNSEKQFWGKLETAFLLFERLGIAVAVAGTGVAMMTFSKKLAPNFVAAPFLGGVALLACAFFLVIFAGAHFIRVMFPTVGKIGTGVATALVLGISIFALRAGMLVAIAALKPPVEVKAQKESAVALPAPAPAQPSAGAATGRPVRPEPSQATPPKALATPVQTPASSQRSEPASQAVVGKASRPTEQSGK
jgi:hypothetical protein